MNHTQAQKILDFWFNALNREDWFTKSATLDSTIKAQFLAIWHQAVAGELLDWRQTLQGRLAEIIVIDQFSRNIWRDKPQAFAFDGMALVLSQALVKQDNFSIVNPF